MGPLPWREQWQTIRRSRSLIRFIVFGAIWGFAYNCLGPFYPVFMYRQLGLSVANVCLFIILNTLAAAVTMPAWGRLLDRFGNKPVMAAAILLWQAQFLIWLFLDRGNAWLLYGLWMWNGFTWAGFTLGLFNMLLKLIPPEAKITAIGLNTAVTSVVHRDRADPQRRRDHLGAAPRLESDAGLSLCLRPADRARPALLPGAAARAGTQGQPALGRLRRHAQHPHAGRPCWA